MRKLTLLINGTGPLLVILLIASSAEAMDELEFQRLNQILQYEKQAEEGDIGKYQVAITECLKWLSEDSDNIFYQRELAWLYLSYYLALKNEVQVIRPELLSSAEDVIGTMVRQDPDSALFYHRIGAIYYEEGNIDKLKDIKSKLKKYIPSDTYLELLVYLAELERNQEEVVVVPDKGIFSEDELDQMQTIKDRINYEIEELYTPEKLARLRQEIESQPNAEKPRMDLVEYYIFTEQFEKAMPLLHQVAKINPDNEMAANLLKSLKNILDQMD